MRARRTVPAFGLAALLVALPGTSVAVAQEDGPVATPRPPEILGVKTAVLRNEFTDPAVNTIIEDTAAFAQEEIGGRIDGRGQPFRTEILPGRTEVVQRARDLADQSAEREDPISIMLMSGGDSAATSGFANAFERTLFIDIDQPLPCLTLDGRRDPEGLCPGGLGVIPANQVTISFDVDQAAYLAGIVAAMASRNDRLGIISGTPECPGCNRTISGFVRGAQSVKPEIGIQIGYLSEAANFGAEGGEAAAFGDSAAAHTYARAFIDVYQPDVILPVAGRASRGIIEAVCETEDRLAIGTDFDVAAAYPDLGECILASIAKDYEYAVREAVFAFANDDLTTNWRLGIDDDRVRVTDEWTRRPGLPVDVGPTYERAAREVLTGQIETCPEGCEDPVDPATLAPAADAGDPPGPEASASPTP